PAPLPGARDLRRPPAARLCPLRDGRGGPAGRRPGRPLAAAHHRPQAAQRPPHPRRLPPLWYVFPPSFVPLFLFCYLCALVGRPRALLLPSFRPGLLLAQPL